MSAWSPCKRRDFIRRLRKLGFDGPFQGAKHQYLEIGQGQLTLPSNPEYSVSQLRMMLREVEEIIGRAITLDEWIKLAR